MNDRVSHRPRPRTVALAAGAAAGAAAATIRHLRTIARDPDYRRLSAPLRGQVLSVRSADGTRLHAERFGAERPGADPAPTVLLVPGWTERLTLFDPLTRRLLDRGFSVLAYDLRGQGRSARPAGDDYAIERYGEDVEAVLVAGVEPGGDAIVAGHSLGAMSLASWALRHDAQARATAAVLMNTGLEGLIAGNRIVPAVVPAAVYSRLATRGFLANPMPVPPLTTPLSTAIVRYTAFGPDATLGQVAFYERMLTQCHPRVRAAAGLMLSTMDLSDAVPLLRMPTLVIAGDADRLTPVSHAERIAETLPSRDELIVLPRTGHMGPLERPEEIAEAIAALWERVGGRGTEVEAAEPGGAATPASRG